MATAVLNVTPMFSSLVGNQPDPVDATLPDADDLTPPLRSRNSTSALRAPLRVPVLRASIRKCGYEPSMHIGALVAVAPAARRSDDRPPVPMSNGWLPSVTVGARQRPAGRARLEVAARRQRVVGPSPQRENGLLSACSTVQPSGLVAARFTGFA